MDVDALAALAGNTLVSTAVSDTFEQVRQKLARIFGHGKPDAGIGRRLDATRQQLTAAAPEERERLRTSLAGQWQTRFADLLADHPEVAAELRTLLIEIQSHGADSGGSVTNTISRTMVEGPVLMGRDFNDISIGTGSLKPGQSSHSGVVLNDCTQPFGKDLTTGAQITRVQDVP